jgi:hypothetical protein
MESPFYKKDAKNNIESLLKFGDPIFEYSSDEVDGENLISLHVRGSSMKMGELDRNQKLIVFFHHKSKIYSWTKKSDFF